MKDRDKNKQTYRQTDDEREELNTQTYRQTMKDRDKNKQTNRQTDDERQRQKQTHIQTDRQ